MGTTFSPAEDVKLESLWWRGRSGLSLRLDGVIADVCAGFVLNGRGGRKGMATENLDARKSVR